MNDKKIHPIVKAIIKKIISKNLFNELKNKKSIKMKKIKVDDYVNIMSI